jgi:hypothetical protein
LIKLKGFSLKSKKNCLILVMPVINLEQSI